MSESLTFDTQENKDNLNFWYQYKPFINEKDGSMDLEIEHDFLRSNDLDNFDFKNPPIDPVNLSASMVQTMRKLGGYGLSANQVGLPLKMFVIEGEPAYAIFNPRITYFVMK